MSRHQIRRGKKVDDVVVLMYPQEHPGTTSLSLDLSARIGSGCNERKPSGADDDPNSTLQGDRKSEQQPTDRGEGDSSSRKPGGGGGGSSAAQAKGGQEEASRNGGNGETKGAGRGLTSLGDLPSLGKKKLVSVEARSWHSDETTNVHTQSRIFRPCRAQLHVLGSLLF